MMEAKQSVLFENVELLMEINDLKMKKSELYKEKGPGNSDYIKVSINLELLVNQYLEEKISHVIQYGA